MNKFIGLTAACALLFAASSASAITYVANRAVGAGFVNLSITTDDTLGVLSTSNITAWDITLDDGINTATLYNHPNAGINSILQIVSIALTATAKDLYFDFTTPNNNINNYAIIYPYTGNVYYCLQGSPCYDYSGPGEGMRLFGGVIQSQAYSGNQIIASVAGGAVPEPGAWALMLAGFGLAGSALRARRRTLAA